jgi:lipoprotein NlpD
MTAALRNLIILLVVTTLLLAGCGSFVIHTVRKGETLYSISFRYGQDYKQVAEWNSIESPYIISPGQHIRISPPLPGAQQHVAITENRTTQVSSTTAVPVNESIAASTVTGRSQTVSPTRSTQSDSSKPPPPAYPQTVAWQWPVKGEIIKTYSARQPGRKGIDISADRGTLIKAAASGRVVYAGEGLASYGKMIIIKHNEEFLSAYAHNQKLLVEEGQNIDAGTIIAEMGDSGTNKVKLHFEVRRKGKPVDPLHYLPK